MKKKNQFSVFVSDYGPIIIALVISVWVLGAILKLNPSLGEPEFKITKEGCWDIGRVLHNFEIINLTIKKPEATSINKELIFYRAVMKSSLDKNNNYSDDGTTYRVLYENEENLKINVWLNVVWSEQNLVCKQVELDGIDWECEEKCIDKPSWKTAEKCLNESGCIIGERLWWGSITKEDLTIEWLDENCECSNAQTIAWYNWNCGDTYFITTPEKISPEDNCNFRSVVPDNDDCIEFKCQNYLVEVIE